MYCQTLITDLEYADDMCLINDSMDKLEEMLQDLDENCNEMGLTISARKTKIMVVGAEQQAPREVQLRHADEHVGIVDEFEYLGRPAEDKNKKEAEVVQVLQIYQLCHMIVRHGPQWPSSCSGYRVLYESSQECQ